MLNLCGIIRPLTIVIAVIGVMSVSTPDLLLRVWPYLAAAGVLLVPIAVYRWWDTRYNPGCSVRYQESVEVTNVAEQS